MFSLGELLYFSSSNITKYSCQCYTKCYTNLSKCLSVTVAARVRRNRLRFQVVSDTYLMFIESKITRAPSIRCSLWVYWYKNCVWKIYLLKRRQIIILHFWSMHSHKCIETHDLIFFSHRFSLLSKITPFYMQWHLIADLLKCYMAYRQ